MNKLKNFYPLIVLLVVVLAPFFAQAQGDIRTHIVTLKDIVRVFIPLLMTLAIAIFIYGVVLFIAAAGDVQKIKDAKNYIIYGLLGLFVLVAFWGLVWVLAQTFSISQSSSPLQPDTYVLPL